MRALNLGDSSAFDAVYYRYRDSALRLAHRFTGNADDALDVVQETFSYFFRKFPGFRLTASMTTFLYPVVRNLSIAARKKRRRLRLGEMAGPDPIAPPPREPGSSREDLGGVLAELPDAQREVLLMRFVDGMALAEIAAALSVPEGTVKSRLHNALHTLRNDPATQRYFAP